MKHFTTRTLIIIFYYLSLTCCTHNKNTTNLTLCNIPVPDIRTDIKIEDIYDSVEMIPLKSLEKVMLNSIRSVQRFENNLYILDGNSAIVALFDLKGNYLKHINWTGKGPNEYLSIFSMKIDPLSRKVILSDNFFKKIFILDLNLNLEKVIKTEFSPTEVSAFRDHCLLNGQPIAMEREENMFNNNLLIVSDAGEVIKGFIPLECAPKYATTSPNKSISYDNQECFLVHPTLSDTIYSISSNLDSVVPKYYINFEMKKLQKLDYSKFIEMKKALNIPQIELLKHCETDNYTFNWGYTINADSNILIRYGNFNPIIVVYNKTKQASISYSPNNITGDVIMRLVTQYPSSAYKNLWYSGMDCATFKILAEQENLTPYWKETVQHLNLDDNPIVFSYKIKTDI